MKLPCEDFSPSEECNGVDEVCCCLTVSFLHCSACVELACGDMSGAISFEFFYSSFVPCTMYLMYSYIYLAHLCCDHDTAELLAL